MERNTLHEPGDQPNRATDAPTPGSGSPHDHTKSAEEIADAYGDIADTLARWRRLDRWFAGRYRRRQFGDVDGRVLDVACGTGRNFRYLPASIDLVGIDISEEMLAHARAERERLGLVGHVERMDAQALRFAENSFDTVISSFSTCTFPDPIAALNEMDRVCEPGGRILLLEHARSDIAPLARLQDWRADAHYAKAGCRLNHEPVETVARAGLSITRVSTGFFGLVTAIEVRPEGSANA